MQLQYFDQKMSFYLFIAISQYCVQKYCVWIRPKGVYIIDLDKLNLIWRFDENDKKSLVALIYIPNVLLLSLRKLCPNDQFIELLRIWSKNGYFSNQFLWLYCSCHQHLRVSVSKPSFSLESIKILRPEGIKILRILWCFVNLHPEVSFNYDLNHFNGSRCVPLLGGKASSICKSEYWQIGRTPFKLEQSEVVQDTFVDEELVTDNVTQSSLCEGSLIWW